MTQDRNHTFVKSLRAVLIVILTLQIGSHALADGVKVTGNVYGGGNLAEVGGSVTVNIKAGTVEKDVYGGGALANTNINNVTAGYGTDNETITYTHTTTVNLMGGTINGDAYGGGLGRLGEDPVAAKVYGNITVNLGGNTDGATANATAFMITNYDDDTDTHDIDESTIVKSGRVFGCNNLNGSPLGSVTVNVYKTVKGNVDRTAEDPEDSGIANKINSVPHTYQLAAVYGGGNLANYTTAGKKTSVNIKTCNVSVESVYGGGNAAAVTETDVTVSGAYEIQYVFGGGNGKDPYTLDNGNNWTPNAGANVNGNTKVLLIGGYIHEAYGGSNEKGTVRGKTNLNTGTGGACDLDVVKLVGAGKNADIDGDAILVLGCMPEAKVDEIYGGADNANVNGNVELTITSGNFGKVFGGNNRGGLIKGHIKLNIEETSCRAINIDELYLGGNEAAYSIYGYYDTGTTDSETGKKVYKPRASETDHTETAVPNPDEDDTHTYPYANPVLNVISCTHIGRVFGGGYGEGAALYGSPTVNLNMIPGVYSTNISRTGIEAAHRLGEIGGTYTNANNEEVDGGVFGGGDGAAVYGNTTVNIGTATTVQMTSVKDEYGELLSTQPTRNVEGAYINCNVYGGGNEANVYGNTQVNICAIDDPSTTDVDYSSVTINGSGYEGVTIKGNVYGGGKGVADNFFCNKAMVGEDGAGANAEKYPNGYPDGNTNVIIGNGMVEGTVYGGGQIGRVEMNTTVTIGLQEETSAPVIKGNVFGAGKGLETHGYAALVRGNPTVTVQGHAKAEKNVYGGGEIASVARYNLVKESDLSNPEFVAAHPGLGVGMPYALAKINGVNTGNCTVIIRDNAEVGTVDDGGNVFGAGQGILPYYDNSNADKTKRSRRMMSYNPDTYNNSNSANWEFADEAHQNVWEYFPTEAKYIEFVQTQGLSSQTDVTVSGNATVRGSVYGGSENGIVQFDAHVNVTGGTIGVGQKGGVTFGNVFGAGKGYVDTARPENLLAGIVRGNTEVTITDGTILHNVYGGGAYGSVGTITTGDVTYVHVPGQESVSNMPVSWARKTSSETSFNTGTATVKITGGTIGVDGHEDGMVFGSSRGDVGAPGSILDHQAWVYESHVIIGDSEHPGSTTTPLIRGSIYGSGENGHVFTNTKVEIHGGTIGLLEAQSTDEEGYTGADYLYRGNVYGGGCGTDKYYSSGTAPEGQTLNDGKGDAYNSLSGCVLGNSEINIDGGHVVHNVYGAGAMGSVGKKDDAESGKTTITISGGRIGDDGVGDGNVYGAARGGQGIGNDLAHVRETEVTINYSTTPDADNGGKTEQLIAGSVFGGGESGTVKENVVVNMEGGLVLHDVYGGGALADTQTSNWNETSNTWADATAKSSLHTTQVNLKGGTVKGDMYGGGLGQLSPSIEAKVYGDVTVTTTGGKAARVFGCNNLNGAPQGKVAVNINGTDTDLNVLDETAYAISNVYGGGNQAAYSYTGDPLTVTMAGGTVNNVFGGGLSAGVAGSIAVNVTGGKVINDVYGGGALAHTNTANWNQGSDPLLKYVEVTGLTVGTTSVAGYYTKSGNVYTLITKMDKAAANTTYYKKTVGGTWASSHPYTTTVDLTGGVVGNVYGGGLGQLAKAAVAAIGTEGQEGYQPAQAAVPAVEANVYGDVTVTVNDPTKLAARLGITAAAAENLASTGGVGVAFTQRRSEKFTIGNSTTEHTVNVTGNVFGCNNLNGTPTGDVTVHVYSTRQLNDNGVIIAGHTPSEIGNENEKYEIQGVYGGGNLADYLPADGKKTNVLIDGCGITSIKKVFGGGNSALVPATDVTITGSHAIGYAFGGGNGGDYIKKNGVWQDNEGAIVIGTASIACHGGKVGSVFGGSDARGVCGGTNINTEASQEGAANYCALKITRIYGAGNEADVTGNVNTIISGCTSEQVEFVHGGSYNAHVSGDVTLTITSGILQNVYGGNDARGSIGGNITVNIEETETSCNKPIIIQNLVGGGNNAPYPGITREGVDLSQHENWHGNITVNVKSATRIDNVYGGCFNAQANADTEVNINMLKGKMAGYSENVSIPKRYYDGVKPTIPNITYVSANGTDNIWCKIKNEIGTIGNVFGGGKEGKVVGNTTVNIGTASTVGIMARNDNGDILNTSNQVISYTSGQNMGNVSIQYSQKPVLGANITENVYGGGELADVTGNAFVNICANKGAEILEGGNHTGKYNYTIVNHSGTTGFEGITIAGNVYGGGKGLADNFFCNKAMVGVDGAGAIDADKDGNPDHPEGGTTVVIGNGTVNGNVYGGGEIARVEKNSDVTIGLGAGVASGTPTSAPIIGGDVFGAGKGIETHGYSALVRGNPSVTVQANAKVNGSVYGGGEIGSVARYKVVNESPVALENSWSGNCIVKVQGYAEIGPEDNMTMPTFSGNVFGAGKGVLPVDYFDGGQTTSQPKRMISDGGKNSWQFFDDKTAYFSFIQTLALASQTSVTVSDHAFVKGSVYGGSENGIVQYDTHVQIQDHCQIGCGANATLRFDEANFIDPSTATVSEINAAAAAMEECAHWPYGVATAAADKYAPYDKYAGTAGYDSRGGRATGDDGHTFYGNVFGGGSGYFPYAPGKWHRAAGIVRGNTVVDITGGHILTSVYGGNEQTDVGTYTEDENTHEPIVYVSGGKCTVNFGGTATLGVPRTRAQIIAHPVTCYLFGSGKGDTRTFFNTWTNVNEVEVNVTGGIIYGSVFGGGEDGHVLGDVKVNISDDTSETSHTNTKIGTWGTSYVDGNVFGAGRGFTGEALTAGSIGGNVTMNISGGTMLGSVYGGGRLASVGIGFTDPLDEYYGQLIDDTTGDNPKTYGHITMNITGGTIGNKNATGDGAEHSGNVFGGSMGRITLLNGNNNPLWPKLAVAKITSVNISEAQGKTTLITRNVYGGSEFGIVRDQATVTISGGTVNGNVFGGGYGSKDTQPVVTIVPAGYPGHYYTFTPMTWSGCVSGNTTVKISGGTVKKNVYGGGELASVGLINFESDAQGNYIGMTKHADPATGFALSWPYEFHYIPANPSSTAIGGKATVKITGSSNIGTDNNDETGYVFGGSKGQVAFGATDDIEEQRYTEAFCANVRETEVTIGTSGGSDNPQIRTVYGGGEDGHVYEDAKVTLHRGTIGHSVFGGGKGATQYTTTLWDPNNEGQPKNTTELAHSWTAGRVYGNTSVTMNGGSVGWFVYGGGNLASVGKGNYAGGSDDYSTAGYGELPNNSVNSGKLWATSSTAESETKDDAYHFLNSGQSTVTIMGGTVGPESLDGVDKYIDKDGIPYGSVFGGSRGQAAASVQLSPRYKYVPDFFLGYVNKTIVNIGGTSTTDLGDGPTIKGSVYGGGQDGHVRNSTEVRIFKGNIVGQGAYESAGRSGNVFGAGSGIGTYKDGTTDKCNNSSGSVTCTALVEITGGSITGSVYGGGAMASVGPPKTGQPLDEQKAASGTTKSYSYTKVDMKGGSVGGSVFGASRGPSDTFLAWRFPNNDYDPTKFATDLWSDVIISGGTIGTATTGGNVYGGGETGYVKCGVTVNILGGEITKDVYGGGALAHTNTSNLKQDKTSKLWSWTDTSSKTAKYTTTVNLLGGTIGGDAYGGGLGRKEHGISGQAGYESPVEATVYGDVKVNLNGLETEDIVESVHGENSEFGNRLEAVYGGRRVKDAEKGAIVTRVFGCNNLNGSPQGGVRVHVFGTQNANSEHNTINNKYPVTDHGTTSTYDVQAVYGGANLAAYTPMGPSAVPGTETTITTDYKNTTQRTEVIIDGCGRTSINQVYGGGNAASAPATYVEVNGTYEIGEVFGGGNGADTFKMKEGNVEIWHQNPGANVGYENYTTWENSTTVDIPGTQTAPYHLAVEDPDFESKKREYLYGSGVATTAIKGGKIHAVYGGSNEKGNISTTATLMIESMFDDCPLDVDESYGGSKNATIDAEIVSRSNCAHGVKELFGGSKNADVNSNVVLTITNGSSFERVFGGNNTSGAIDGSITVNIEEGGCEPIIIQELYAGGYLAPYSIYGYQLKQGGGYATEEIDYGGTIGKIEQRIPLTSGENPQNDPRINVISATRIDNIFGGGYQALVVGNPHINVNMTKGKVEVTEKDGVYKDANDNSYTTVSPETAYYATVNNTKIEVQKVEWTSAIDLQLPSEDKAAYITESSPKYVYRNGNTFYKVVNVQSGTKYWATLDIGTIGNIYGGGNLADIDGDTYVEIGTGTKHKDDGTLETLDPARNAAHITGDVFGGGNDADVTGDTHVIICANEVNENNKVVWKPVANASVTIEGTPPPTGGFGRGVFGGGNLGEVKKNTYVYLGGGSVNQSVYGGGCRADVLGNTNVTMLDGYVFDGIAGGGLAGSVGTVLTRTAAEGHGENVKHGENDCVGGKPDTYEDNTGKCTVVVTGGQVGPVTVATQGMPVAEGWIWGAGRGEVTDPSDDPDTDFKTYVKETDVTIGGTAFILEGVVGGGEFGRVRGDTHVTIEGDCQIGVGAGKAEIISGSGTEADPYVYGKPLAYSSNQWAAAEAAVTAGNADAINTAAASMPECPHWPYGEDTNSDGIIDQYQCLIYDPYYDKYYDKSTGVLKDNIPEDLSPASTNNPSDGKTWIGVVFGGGSGYMPYEKSDGSGYDWVRSAGLVEGNALLEIKGGHILTNVYGGNEYTDVLGKSTVKMSGGTIGVPRTLEQIKAHPVTCYLFGAGRGDERTHFNTRTNVGHAEVEVSGGIIYGSVFGGGEDGHVLGDVKVTIKGDAKIGTWGTSYVDGNVFGGGRGFSGIAQTAGTVGGNVTLNIKGGTMLGSIYGGGRLASVGTQFTAPDDVDYGNFEEDIPAVNYTQAECDAYNTLFGLTTSDTNYKTTSSVKTHGHVTVNISGGIIGNENASGDGAKYSGNVFGGSMGRLTLLNGDTNPIWPKMAQVKQTNVNIYDNATIYRNVYGGGEMGTVRNNAYVTIGGYKTADADEDGNVAVTKSGSPIVKRDVYGGGYGSKDRNYTIITVKEPNANATAPYSPGDYEDHTYAFTPMQFAGCVGSNTYINVVGGKIKKSVYGGGEMASVGVINCRAEVVDSQPDDDKFVVEHQENSSKWTIYSNMVKHGDESKEFALSWPYEFKYVDGYEGATHINITGGRIGLTKTEDDNNPFDDKDNGDVYGGGKGIAGDYKEYIFCANVGSTKVNVNYPTTNTATSANYMSDAAVDCIAGALYGGAENGHVMGDTKVTLTNGLIGHSMYGGGSGKGQFETWLTEIPADRRQLLSGDKGNNGPETRTNDKGETEYKATCYSITAGKVFGNTEVNMTGGSVLRNIYGGGNMGSVGKGNYAGGADDYSTAGYGETLNENEDENLKKLWTPSTGFNPQNPISSTNKPTTNADYFLSSGKCKVTVTGGTIGYVNESDPNKSMYPLDAEKKPYAASLPYGNIFGGCRGEAAPNILESPRYLYCPEFFVGYANETEITVGTSGQDNENAGEPGKAPRIWGSVYGGGQDGHIRRDASVTINSGEIGMAFTYDNRLNKLKTLAAETTEEQAKTITSDLDNLQWLARGNVYGAGSGMGKYRYDINHDGDFGDKVNYTTPTTPSRTTPMAEEDNSTSAGSVTRFTTVNINGGKIHRNVYGGGSLSTVGAPKIGQNYLPYRKDDTAEGHGVGKQSQCTVTIGGAGKVTIGTPIDYQAHYGGEVYGACRGTSTLDTNQFASSVWTQVWIKDGATILGNVFGGGDAGMVKRDSEVIIGEAKTE